MCQRNSITDFSAGFDPVEIGGQTRGNVALAVDEPEEFDNEFEEFDEDDFDDDFDDDFEQEIVDSDGVGTIEFEED